MAGIDTVVFDLGDVIIPWNPRKLYRKLFDDEAAMEAFLREVCTPEWNARQDGGRPIAEGIAERVAAFPQFEDLIRAYYDRWAEMLGEAIEGSVLLMRELKMKGFRVLALTNWSAETFAGARRLYPVLEEFEGIVVSGHENMIKPEAAIYQLLCSRYGIQPERAVFLDDNPHNVEGAKAVGMHAIHFRDPEQARSELRSLGLPV